MERVDSAGLRLQLERAGGPPLRLDWFRTVRDAQPSERPPLVQALMDPTSTECIRGLERCFGLVYGGCGGEEIREKRTAQSRVPVGKRERGANARLAKRPAVRPVVK